MPTLSKKQVVTAPKSKRFRIGSPISLINQQNIAPYRGMHQGKTAVLVGTGPTLNDYHPISDAIHIGVNNSIYFPHPMDYLFLMDQRGPTTYLANKKDYDSYQARIQKFYAKFRLQSEFGVTDADARAGNAKFFEVIRPTTDYLPGEKDVGNRLFGLPVSTIFTALQFILYTGVTQIYIVGCDLSDDNYKIGARIRHAFLDQTWVRVKSWIQKAYPTVRIGSINPQGLKGMFQDFEWSPEQQIYVTMNSQPSDT